MNKLYLGALSLFLILFLVGGAFAAANINLPSTAYVGETWQFTSMDCPNQSHMGDGCWVAWTGPSNGSYYENDDNPDPDAGYQDWSFSTAGTYIFTITECDDSTHCNASPSDTESIDIIAMPTASIDVPANAFQGELWNFVMDCPEMNHGGDECLVEWTGPESGSFTENDSDPDPDSSNTPQTLFLPGTYIYTIKSCPTGAPGSCGAVEGTDTIEILDDVSFVAEASTTGSIWTTYRSRITGPFAPTLNITGIFPTGTAKVQIYIRGEDNGATVVPMALADLNTENNYYSKNFGLQDVFDNDPQILNVQARFLDSNDVEIVSARITVEALLLDSLTSRIDELETRVDNIDTDLSSVWDEIDEINTALNDLQTTVIDLQEQIDELENTLLALIDDLDQRVEDLEDAVDMLNDGTIEFNYDSDNDEMTIFGEAPLNAQCVKVYAYTSSGSLEAYEKTSVSQNTSGADYSVTKDTDGWPQESYNVFTKFYANSSCRSYSYIGTVSDTFDSLLGEFGFSNITTSTYVTSYYTNEVEVPITFALKTDSGGLLDLFGGALYTIEYNVDGEGWEDLVGCSWYDEGIKTYQNGMIELDSTGTKEIQLRAKRCIWNTIDYESYVFKIKHVDLKDELDASTTIVSPGINSDMTLTYPYGSIADNVYWTQSGMVPLLSYLTTNTEQDRPTCEITYFDGLGVGRPIGDYPSIADAPGSWVCNAGALSFGTNEWSGTNYIEGKYTTLRIMNDVVTAVDGYDDIKIGIDDTEPVIASINPDEAGIMNGSYKWSADISDNLSGIAQVDFFMKEKSGYEYCDLNGEETVCWIGDGNTVWSVMNVDFNADTNKWFYNLNTLNFPDGDYNVAFEAYDIAGNYSYMEVDPVIDNTAPVIHSITVVPDPMMRGKAATVTVIATDNLTGVKEVKSTLDGNTITLTADGNTYTGTYYTDTSWEVNAYDVTVTAEDVAGNVETQTISVNLFQMFYFNIANQSRTIAAGTTTIFDINGNFRADDGNVPTDMNTILITSSVVGDVNKVFDENGLYTISTISLSAGTYYIDLNYNTADYNYTQRVTLSVTNPSLGGGSRGGSSGGGAPRTIDTNTPVDENVVEEPVVNEPTGELPAPRVTPPATTEETLPVTTTGATNETPSGPTGLFGLGDAGTIGLGLLGILILALIVGIVWKVKK